MEIVIENAQGKRKHGGLSDNLYYQNKGGQALKIK